MLEELSVGRDSASEFWRCASGAGGDVCCVVAAFELLLSGCGALWSVVLRFSVGLGGITVAVSADIPVVEDAGLVRRLRRGPVLAPLRRRACLGCGLGIC
jgi:hypothetical protein